MLEEGGRNRPFGLLPNGRAASLYTLENSQLRVSVTDYGGRLVSVETPDRDGRREHVVLGFDDVAGYIKAGGAAFGAVLGRTAGRISGGCFTLGGRTYQLSKNEPDATLHGGKEGFDKALWRVLGGATDRLLLAHSSPDGDQGFPGNVAATAAWRLDETTLWLELDAVTDAPTPLSLSAHPYFNLAGPAAGGILSHIAAIAAERFLPTDDRQVTGDIRPVAGTPFDFRQPTEIGARIRAPDAQLLIGKGYDHYFVLCAGADEPAARVADPGSGRVLEILTTQPGMQFYTGNNLDGRIAGRGGAYRQSAGLAFEPQGFPDAPNRPQFPSTILHPGERYRQRIGYRFTTA